MNSKENLKGVPSKSKEAIGKAKLSKSPSTTKGGGNDLTTGRDNRIYDEHMRLVEVELKVSWNKKERGSYIELDSWKRIVFIHEDAQFALEKLIVGDYVTMVNGKVYANEKETENAMYAEKCTVVMMRKADTSAIPLSRAKAIGLVRKPNFIYLVADVEQKKCDIGKRLGVVLLYKSKMFYVCQIQPDSPAVDVLQIGDALLDLDTVPIPENDPFFIKNFPYALEKKGGFSVVIERPLNSEIIPFIIQEALGQGRMERPMSHDAVAIGAKASKEYQVKMRNYLPKPILKETKVARTQRSKEKSKEKTKEKEEFEWKKNQEYNIGTDVKEYTKLRQVERDEKDQTKKKRRPRVFEDFYDVL